MGDIAPSALPVPSALPLLDHTRVFAPVPAPRASHFAPPTSSVVAGDAPGALASLARLSRSIRSRAPPLLTRTPLRLLRTLELLRLFPVEAVGVRDTPGTMNGDIGAGDERVYELIGLPASAAALGLGAIARVLVWSSTEGV